jgi:hypothetical protein
LAPVSNRLLCVDIENKPGTYGPGDYTHGKITAIGWRFLDEHKTKSILLDRSSEKMMQFDLMIFRAIWDQADAVVGHNFRRHDVKHLDGLAMSLGEVPFAKKRIVDTYMDLPKRVGVSFSLENCADRFGCPIQKMSMSEFAWERAYDGDPQFLPMMKKRVQTDVDINIWLYHDFRDKGWLA